MRQGRARRALTRERFPPAGPTEIPVFRREAGGINRRPVTCVHCRFRPVRVADRHMKFAHFDPFSGVSGDMILGCLLDAGLSRSSLCAELDKLGVGGFSIESRKVMRGPIAATKVDVLIDDSAEPLPPHPDGIIRIIAGSRLDDAVKDKASRTVSILAEAEASVHGTTVDRIHFHEVGSLDALIDIAGAAAGLRLLGVDSVSSSPVATGRGEVECSHGRLPVPAPATAEILRGVPTFEAHAFGELATPTGAAILKAHCSAFGQRPPGTFTAVGYGAGGREDGAMPNALRLFLGFGPASWDSMFQVEVNLDDVTPQTVGMLFDELFKAGSVDVWVTPVHMKKNRPGFVVSALCPASAVPHVEAVFFRETSTLGTRRFEARRTVLDRSIKTVATRFGPIRIKTGTLPDGNTKSAPEYEDCLEASRRCGVPLADVFREAGALFSAGEGGQ